MTASASSGENEKKPDHKSDAVAHPVSGAASAATPSATPAIPSAITITLSIDTKSSPPVLSKEEQAKIEKEEKNFQAFGAILRGGKVNPLAQLSYAWPLTQKKYGESLARLLAKQDRSLQFVAQIARYLTIILHDSNNLDSLESLYQAALKNGGNQDSIDQFDVKLRQLAEKSAENKVIDGVAKVMNKLKLVSEDKKSTDAVDKDDKAILVREYKYRNEGIKKKKEELRDFTSITQIKTKMLRNIGDKKINDIDKDQKWYHFLTLSSAAGSAKNKEAARSLVDGIGKNIADIVDQSIGKIIYNLRLTDPEVLEEIKKLKIEFKYEQIMLLINQCLSAAINLNKKPEEMAGFLKELSSNNFSSLDDIIKRSNAQLEQLQTEESKKPKVSGAHVEWLKNRLNDLTYWYVRDGGNTHIKDIEKLVKDIESKSKVNEFSSDAYENRLHAIISNLKNEWNTGFVKKYGNGDEAKAIAFLQQPEQKNKHTFAREINKILNEFAALTRDKYVKSINRVSPPKPVVVEPEIEYEMSRGDYEWLVGEFNKMCTTAGNLYAQAYLDNARRFEIKDKNLQFALDGGLITPTQAFQQLENEILRMKFKSRMLSTKYEDQYNADVVKLVVVIADYKKVLTRENAPAIFMQNLQSAKEKYETQKRQYDLLTLSGDAKDKKSQSDKKNQFATPPKEPGFISHIHAFAGDTKLTGRLGRVFDDMPNPDPERFKELYLQFKNIVKGVELDSDPEGFGGNFQYKLSVATQNKVELLVNELISDASRIILDEKSKTIEVKAEIIEFLGINKSSPDAWRLSGESISRQIIYAYPFFQIANLMSFLQNDFKPKNLDRAPFESLLFANALNKLISLETLALQKSFDEKIENARQTLGFNVAKLTESILSIRNQFKDVKSNIETKMYELLLEPYYPGKPLKICLELYSLVALYQARVTKPGELSFHLAAKLVDIQGIANDFLIQKYFFSQPHLRQRLTGDAEVSQNKLLTALKQYSKNVFEQQVTTPGQKKVVDSKDSKAGSQPLKSVAEKIESDFDKICQLAKGLFALRQYPNITEDEKKRIVQAEENLCNLLMSKNFEYKSDSLVNKVYSILDGIKATSLQLQQGITDLKKQGFLNVPIPVKKSTAADHKSDLSLMSSSAAGVVALGSEVKKDVKSDSKHRSAQSIDDFVAKRPPTVVTPPGIMPKLVWTPSVQIPTVDEKVQPLFKEFDAQFNAVLDLVKQVEMSDIPEVKKLSLACKALEFKKLPGQALRDVDGRIKNILDSLLKMKDFVTVISATDDFKVKIDRLLQRLMIFERSCRSIKREVINKLVLSSAVPTKMLPFDLLLISSSSSDSKKLEDLTRKYVNTPILIKDGDSFKFYKVIKGGEGLKDRVVWGLVDLENSDLMRLFFSDEKDEGEVVIKKGNKILAEVVDYILTKGHIPVFSQPVNSSSRLPPLSRGLFANMHSQFSPEYTEKKDSQQSTATIFEAVGALPIAATPSSTASSSPPSVDDKSNDDETPPAPPPRLPVGGSDDDDKQQASSSPNSISRSGS